MNPTLFRQARRRGSASIAAMAICLAGCLGLLGMISVMQARHSMIEATEDKALRRVRLLNGRQLAKEVLYRRVLSAESGLETTVSLASDWGRVTVPAWNANPYSTDQLSAIANQFCPSPDLEPFVTSVTASIFTRVDESSAWSAPEAFVCNLNAQNPALAGLLLEVRRPADNGAANSVSGDLLVEGRALVFQNPSQNNSFLFEASSVNAPSSSLSLSNFDVTTPSRPENFPMLPLPEGVASGAYVKGDRSGVAATGSTVPEELMEIAAAEGQTINAADVIDANGIESNGSGVVTVTVGHFSLTHTIIQGNLTTLNLIGQGNAAEAVAVEYLAPVIVISNSTTLANVNFTALNRRPFILAHASAEANASQVIAYSFPAGADFRLFFFQQDANSAFFLSGSATVRGGLSLDFGTSVSGGTLVVGEETNKYIFQSLLPRSAWLESYRQL